MKKILVGLAVVTFLVTGLVIPSQGLAQQPSVDIAVLQAQIQALLAMIQQLQNQLNALSSGSTPGGGPVNPVVIEVGQVDRATRLRVGDRVQAKDYLRVRSSASLSGTIVMTVQPGTKGTMAGNLKWDGTYWWAEVYWDNRTRGYSVDDYLSLISMPTSRVCGDLNDDGIVNIQDTTWMQLYIFENAPIPTGVNADMNADGRVDILDKTLLEAYALRGGPAPSCKNDQSLVLPSFKSPSAGEQWQAGMTHRFAWGGGDPNQQFLLAIETGVREYFLPAGRPLSVSEIGYNWSIPVNFTPGTYRVVLFAPNDTLTLSDNVVIAEQHFVVVPGVFVPDYSMCGDANGDRSLTIVDQDQIRRVAFGGLILPAGAKTDLNGDGVVNILDVTLITNYLNQGGAAPTCTAPLNQPPSSAGISGPASVIVNTSGTWQFSATDPEGGALTYQINWDDGATASYNINSGFPISLSHIYLQTGIKTIRLMAIDKGGLSISNPWNVNVQTRGSFACGDINLDGMVNSLDSILMRSYWIGGVAIPAGVNADMNGDGIAANILDFSLLDAYALRGGPAPTCASVPITTGPFACGDIDKNRVIEYSDIDALSQYIFNNKEITDLNLVDLNRDGAPDIVDLVILTNYVKRQGPAPTCEPKALDSLTPSLPAEPVYVCGDVDGDSGIDLGDVDTLNAYVFQGANPPKGETDVNGDGAPNITDVIILSNYLKGRGAIPVCGKAVRLYQCGDVNLDGVINQLDIDYLTYYAFYNGTLPPGVSPDFNGDGVGNIVDVARLTDHVIRGGPAPTCYAGASDGKNFPKSTPLLGASLLDVLINYLKSL